MKKQLNQKFLISCLTFFLLFSGCSELPISDKQKAIDAYKEDRLDIVLNELGEIEEYTEQMEHVFTAKGVKAGSLNTNIEHAQKMAKEKSQDTLAQLERVRQDLIQLTAEFKKNK